MHRFTGHAKVLHFVYRFSHRPLSSTKRFSECNISIENAMCHRRQLTGSPYVHLSSSKGSEEDVCRRKVLAMVRNNDCIRQLDNSQLASISVMMGSLLKSTSADLVTQVMGALRFMVHQHAETDAPATLAAVNEHLCCLRARARTGDSILSVKQWSKCIGNLRNFNSSDKHVVVFLQHAVLDLIGRAAALKSAHIGSMMFGMRYMSSSVVEVRQLVGYIAGLISDCPDEFSPQSISSMLYGIQSMSNDFPEMDRLLRAYTDAINHCRIAWGPQEVGNSLYGLKSMSSEGASCRDLLCALRHAVRRSKGLLNGQEIGNAVYGLNSMSSDVEEVSELLKALTEKIQKVFSCMSENEFSMALYGLKAMSEESPAVLALIAALLNQVKGRKCNFGPQNIANSLFGLQCMRANSDQVKSLITFISASSGSCREPFRSVELGSAIYGLKSMDASIPEVRQLVSMLGVKLRHVSGPVTALTLSNALYGLQNLDNTSAAVGPLMIVLAEKFSACPELFDARNIGNSMYGLRFMSTIANVPPLEYLLKELLEKISKSRSSLSGQALSNALYGLQSMGSDNMIVRDLLAAMITKIPSNVTFWSVQELSAALYGLQSCRSDCIEVQMLLRAIIAFIGSEPLDARGVGNSLYGLQNMNTNCVEVVQLLYILCSKIENCADVMPPQELGIALYGMRNMSSSISAVANILSFLRGHLMFLSSSDTLRDQYSTKALQDLCRYVRISSFASLGWWQDDIRDEMTLLADSLTAALNVDDGSFGPSDKEHQLFMQLKEYFSIYPLVSVTANEYLFDFEADIVIRIRGSVDCDQAVVVNIELDGGHHDYPAKKLFSYNRDSYLSEKHNVRVMRYRLEHIHKFGAADIALSIENEISAHGQYVNYKII